MSQASDGGDGGGQSSSNQMATLVPSFDPAKDDLEQYSQKVELLGEIWPASKYNELITRLILNTSGTAFQKLQLNKDKLLTNDKSGIRLLVTLLGGQWGKLEAEDKFELFERALFQVQQKQDETHDSYLARHDAAFEDLLGRKVGLEEVRAYVLLRQSLLSSEDRKKVIMDQGGQLTYENARKQIRLLGSKFFQDLQAGGGGGK